MKSKTSFFNRGVFKSTLRRYWPLWLAHFLIWFLTLTLPVLISRGNGTHTDTVHAFLRSALGLTPFAAFLFALFAAMAVYGFMYKPRETGLIASLPVKREAVFVSSWLAAFLPVLCSNVVTALFTYLFSISADLDMSMVFSGICTWFGIYTLEFILFFGMASIIAVMTGNSVALPILYLIFNFLAVAMEAVVRAIISALVWGVDCLNGSVLDFLSPLVYFLRSSVSPYSYYQSGIATRADWTAIIIYAAAGIVLSICALLIYRKRRMESAGDVVSVKCMRPVFKYGVSICAALCGGYFLYIIMYSLVSTRNAQLAIMIFSMIVFAFIGYFAALMLLKKSFHVFRGSWVGFIIVGCLCVIFALGCDLDIVGVGRRVPDASEVKSVSLGYASDITNSNTIEAVTELHKDIIYNKDKYENINENAADTTYIQIEYKLKNGSTLLRSYKVTIGSKIDYDYNRIENMPETLVEMYTPPVPVDTKHCLGADIVTADGDTFTLTQEQAIDFYNNAMMIDVKNGNAAPFDNSDENVASVDIYLSNGSSYYDNDLYFDVMPGCTSSIQWIKDNLGVDLSAVQAKQ